MDILKTIVLIVIGIALIWLLVEIALIVRRMRVQLEPTLVNVKNITTSIEPAMGKVNPLLERVLLLLDTVNLELMRVDRVLEPVGAIANAPVKLAETVFACVQKVLY